MLLRLIFLFLVGLIGFEWFYGDIIELSGEPVNQVMEGFKKPEANLSKDAVTGLSTEAKESLFKFFSKSEKVILDKDTRSNILKIFNDYVTDYNSFWSTFSLEKNVIVLNISG